VPGNSGENGMKEKSHQGGGRGTQRKEGKGARGTLLLGGKILGRLGKRRTKFRKRSLAKQTNKKKKKEPPPGGVKEKIEME